MTFHHLAEMILRQTDKPLTANEIWQQAVQGGLDLQLNSEGEPLFIDASEMDHITWCKQCELTDEEVQQLVTNCDRFKSLKHSSSNPYVFTEQGIAMLSAVLRSDIAVQVSIQIMNAFVVMRRQLHSNQLVLSRLDKLEQKQLTTDQKLEEVFKALESKWPEKEKGVFFEGQVFDAYRFVSDIIRKANQEIILIDNYIDDTVLTLLSRRKTNVTCKIHQQTA